MTIKLTLAQLSRILEVEKPKYPITIKMKGIDRGELDKVIQQLKAAKRKP